MGKEKGVARSANEGEVRVILDTSLKLNRTVFQIASLWKDWCYKFPTLTDEECRSIALNYPITYRDVRSCFGAKAIIKTCIRKEE